MDMLKRTLSNPFKRQTFRNPKTDKIMKWSQAVLDTAENYSKVIAEISNIQNHANNLKKNLVVANKVLFEKVTLCSKYCFTQANVRDEDIAVGIDDETEIPNPFHEAVTKLTSTLFLIQVDLENESEELQRASTNCFHHFMEQNPIKKLELKENLTYGLKCVRKEMDTQKGHENLFGFRQHEKHLSFASRDPPTLRQVLEWNSSMGKAQISEAMRLTDEAFSQVNGLIAENQENIRRDILKFLKQFIIIEIQHYCKALEHLTQAYGLAKESEKFIPMSSAESSQEIARRAKLDKIVEQLAKQNRKAPLVPSMVSGLYFDSTNKTRQSDPNQVASAKTVFTPTADPSHESMTPNQILALQELALLQKYQSQPDKSKLSVERLNKDAAASSTPLDQQANERSLQTLLPSFITSPSNQSSEDMAALGIKPTDNGISAIGSKLYGPINPKSGETNQILNESKKSPTSTQSQTINAFAQPNTPVRRSEGAPDRHFGDQNSAMPNRQRTSTPLKSENYSSRSLFEKQLLAATNQNDDELYENSSKDRLSTINESDWSAGSSDVPKT